MTLKTSQAKFFQYLGINFLRCADFEKAILQLDQGARMVAPSGPGMATLESDHAYAKALLTADFAITDSGLMVLYLKLFGITVTRYSGPRFIRDFLDFAQRNKKILLVNPNIGEEAANHQLFRSRGWSDDNLVSHVAPMYGNNKRDPVLLSLLESEKPDYIILNIGGGVQEIVGYHLSQESTSKAGIICTGSALAFLTGKQSRIPKMVDKLYLGWLARCLADPFTFVPRYCKALGFIRILLKSALPARL